MVGVYMCVLDWGMTLGVPEDLQYSLINFIAHVNANDLDTRMDGLSINRQLRSHHVAMWSITCGCECLDEYR